MILTLCTALRLVLLVVMSLPTLTSSAHHIEADDTPLTWSHQVMYGDTANLTCHGKHFHPGHYLSVARFQWIFPNGDYSFYNLIVMVMVLFDICVLCWEKVTRVA